MDKEQLADLEKKYQELVERYGDDLPNSTNYPRMFQYYVNMMRWHKEIQKLTVDSKK